jgi:glucose-1-phosphate cytidylyltransferase
MARNHMNPHHKRADPWKVTLVDIGEESMSGGRLKRVQEYIKDESDFFFTYGDGVADVNIAKTLDFHRYHGKLATLTATYPPGRFGVLTIEQDSVRSFREKPKGDGAMINGDFFVLSPKVIDLIDTIRPLGNKTH